jgi:hypothetical protein
MPTVTLEPTLSFDGSLEAAILSALAAGAPATVALRASPDATRNHYTSPGANRLIEVGAGGLKLLAAASNGALRPIVRRPARSIVAPKTDGNFGLYFVPARPSDSELVSIEWKRHQGPTEEVDFGVIMRGAVTVRGLTFDCNMDQQDGLKNLDATQIEHSAMLGFSGMRYQAPKVNGLKRFVYVGFARVTVEDCLFIHGGFSDDLWINRGGFHPNISEVTLRDIISRDRVSKKRASITFSGLAQKVTLQNLNVESLRIEESGNLREDPRSEESFKLSRWKVTGVTAERASFTAKGDVYQLNVVGLEVTKNFGINEARGVIAQSKLMAGTGDDRRLIRMNNFLFDVEWHFVPDAAGQVQGLRPMARNGKPCSVRFRNNRFVIDGSVAPEQMQGAIFDSGGFQSAEAPVTFYAEKCIYPDQFGRDASRPIARVNALGTWRFLRTDFGDRPPIDAIQSNPSRGKVTVTDTIIKVSIA